MEYAENRELFALLVARKRLPEKETLDLFRQLIHAPDNLHRFGICHRISSPRTSCTRVMRGDRNWARDDGHR
jgi:hypothetical protein